MLWWYLSDIVVDMYVAKVPNRGSPPAILLRESYREDGKVKNRTLSNLSHWPEDKVEALSAVLKGLPPKHSIEGSFSIIRSLPHGHVAAVLGMVKSLGLDSLIDAVPSRFQRLVLAMIVSQVIDPDSKLAISRALRSDTASSSLGEVLGLELVDVNELYEAMDQLLLRQKDIEDALALRHLKGATLVLYDSSTAAFEGKTCPLGVIGHPKDGVRGRLQIVYGLLTSVEGIPIAIEVFAGNTADPNTLSSQIEKIKQRFGVTNICFVGDRGMLTKTRIKDDVIPAQLDYLSALRSPEIKGLIEQGALQLSLFDERDLFEIDHPDYPGERLVACKNPFLAVERATKRESLLRATEAELKKIASATKREKRPLRGKEQIALKVGKVINHYKMAKHFSISITDDSFTYTRKEDQIAKEAALDGIYVLKTSVSSNLLTTEQVVYSYKSLSQVERAFRCLNNDLDIRPIRHRTEDRVRAHVFLRMLSYYVSYHMEEKLAPMLFRDDDKQAALSMRTSPVAPAQRSESALRKIHSKHNNDGQPVHSFKSLLADLSTIVSNHIKPNDEDFPDFVVITTPTTVQKQAYELLGVSHRLGYM